MSKTAYYSNVSTLPEMQLKQMLLLHLAFATGNAGVVRAERKIDGESVFLICAVECEHEHIRLFPLAELVGVQATDLYEICDDMPPKEHVN